MTEGDVLIKSILSNIMFHIKPCAEMTNGYKADFYMVFSKEERQIMEDIIHGA